MATDSEDWSPDDYDLYAKLLRIPTESIIRKPFDLGRLSRNFHSVRDVGDVFLDPDVGVATGKVKDRRQYALVQDIVALACSGMNRVVAVYQHVRAQRTRDRVIQIVDTMPSLTSWTSYESGSVAMLFFSLAPWRTEEVASGLREILGRHAHGRIFSGSVTVQPNTR